MGRVAGLTPDADGGSTLRVEETAMATSIVLGESIAVNGCCLTVTRFDSTTFDFQAGPETLAKTSLGSLAVNDAVNLERALRLGDALGGHLVTGHIDGVGTVNEIIPNGQWQTIWFDCPKSFDALMVHKGSIAVDGVSLTLVDVQPGKFSVMLIPHTLAHTTLGKKGLGAMVNIECDLLAKHVQKLFNNLSIVI
ncbi:riboflavin synthase [soil metagenome]